jgi:hypothetical protein
MPPYAKKKRVRLWPRKTLRVLAGPPVDLSEYYGCEPTVENLRGATDKIMDALTELLAELRGEPAPAVRFDPRKARAEAARKTLALQERERSRAARRRRQPQAERIGPQAETGTSTEESEA